MQRSFVMLACVLALAGVSLTCGHTEKRTFTFESVSPEEAGFSSEKIKVLEGYLAEIGSAAFLGLYDGKVFFSWGEVDKKYLCHSIRKAFMSALYGIYVHRGEIDLEKTLGELGIDDIPPGLTESERQAKVVDLIKSRSGVYHPAAAEAASMIENRPQRGSHAPGTFFYYNNWDFNVAGAIFEQETGIKIFEALYKEIAQPLDMWDFEIEDGFYYHEKEKSIYPAYHLRMTARDMALFGLLYQRDGVWQGEQIVPREWISVSTTAHSVFDDGLGYGYMWYVLPEEMGVGRAFLHTGAGVHMLAVFPDLKLVIVHRVDTDGTYRTTLADVYRLFDLVFEARAED